MSGDKLLNIYESPTCGCCDLWADYMKTKGYKVLVHKNENFLKIKEKNEYSTYISKLSYGCD
ncbi:hypothetical protein CAAR111675_05210 [Campylobacter armoricus]